MRLAVNLSENRPAVFGGISRPVRRCSFNSGGSRLVCPFFGGKGPAFQLKAESDPDEKAQAAQVHLIVVGIDPQGPVFEFGRRKHVFDDHEAQAAGDEKGYVVVLDHEGGEIAPLDVELIGKQAHAELQIRLDPGFSLAVLDIRVSAPDLERGGIAEKADFGVPDESRFVLGPDPEGFRDGQAERRRDDVPVAVNAAEGRVLEGSITAGDVDFKRLGRANPVRPG